MKRISYVIKQTKIIFSGIILFSLVICMLNELHQTATQESFSKMRVPDFQAYYSIGYITKEFGVRGLYNFDNQRKGQEEATHKNGLLKPKESFVGLMSIRIPPVTALIFVPLAKLPYNLAYKIVLAINTLLLGGLAVFIHHHKVFGEVKFKKLCLLFLIFPPLFENLNGGQISFLLLWIITISFWLRKNGKNLESGLVLSLTAIKPNFLILPFLAGIADFGEFLAGKKPGVKSEKFPGFLAGIIAGLTILLFLNYLLYGKGFLPTYAKFLMESESYEYGTRVRLNFNVSSILEKFSLEQSKINKMNFFINTFLLGIISLDFLLKPFLGGWKSWEKSLAKKSREEKFMLATLFTPILNLHTMPVDMSVVILPILFFGSYFAFGNYWNYGKETKTKTIAPKMFLYTAVFSPWLMYFNLVFVATTIYLILGFAVYIFYAKYSRSSQQN